jgi:ABC-type branched-subunit amino acid transport system substrate-binding protein
VLRRSWLRLVCVLVLATIVGTACGSSSRGNDAGSNTTTTAGDTAATSTKFGDLDSPCGKGDAKGATDQGVTDTAITIAYGDDAGFTNSPGLNHEMADAIKGMVKWCNDQGGINGRTVDAKYYDAKITEVANVMTEACASAFMLVGEGWSLDSIGEQKRVECGLSAVPGFAVSPGLAHGPGMVQAVPNPVDFTPVQIAASIAKAFPDKVAKTAVMYANYPATIDTKDKVLGSYPDFGFKFLPCPQEYNIQGESDWKPFANKLKACGAEVVYFTGSPYPNFENFLEAANQLDYHPIYITDANFYDQAFAKWNKDGLADNVYVREAFPPLDAADKIPAIKAYLDIVQGNGGDVNQLGEQSASSFLLWATAAKACGSDLTRACMAKELAKVTEWTGGGLHAKTNPASNKPPECGLVLKLEGAKYVQFDPKAVGELDCSPDYVKQVTGPVVDNAKLGPDRVSTLFTK